MTATPFSVRAELFGPERRAATVGLVLLISLVAFEAMGVGTAMPAVVADLGGVALYAWPFVSFLAAAVLATVLGGQWSDRAGPRPPILAGTVLFGVGLLVAGTATTMAQLLVGRVLQGLGAGGLSVAASVMIAAVYPERLRPAVFGLVSSAWVLPALLGPPIAGVVTETVSWHWVFLGLVPLVVLALALVAPAVRRLERPGDAPGVRRGTALSAVGVAVGVAALSWAGQHPSVLGAVVAVVAFVLLVPSLRVLLPRGVFRMARGIPMVVVARGLLSGTFFTVNAYLPLMLHGTHGWSLAAAGIPLIAGSLSWSASAAWQARRPDLPRARLLQAGFVAVTVGAAGMLLVAPTWGVGWLAVPFWVIAGAGMGLGFSSISVLVLSQSPPPAIGSNSAATQMADQLSVATLVGAGGALLALWGSPAAALPVLVAVVTGLAALGAITGGRAQGTTAPAQA